MVDGVGFDGAHHLALVGPAGEQQRATRGRVPSKPRQCVAFCFSRSISVYVRALASFSILRSAHAAAPAFCFRTIICALCARAALLMRSRSWEQAPRLRTKTFNAVILRQIFSQFFGGNEAALLNGVTIVCSNFIRIINDKVVAISREFTGFHRGKGDH